MPVYIQSILGKSLALGYILFRCFPFLTVRVFIKESITFVFRITVTVKPLLFHTLLGQLELALHYERGKTLTHITVRICVECVL